MSKYEAVDRMMAMASAKRSDPEGASKLPIAAAHSAAGASSAADTDPPAEPLAERLHTALDSPPPSPSSSKARTLLQAARPFLPIVAGAIRGADGVAFQALGRLLPLLGHALGAGAALPPAAAPGQPTTLEAGALPMATAEELARNGREYARRLDALTLRAESADEDARRLRSHLERLQAEHSTLADGVRKLREQLRMVTVAAVLLLMLLVAQLVVTVIVLHR